jgi:predicted metal-dependent phosphoesterase TrpH
MDHRIIDLHVHSTESDGTLTPEDLVAEAKKAELAAFALTDHDTCQGVGKAMPLAASAGIELIPGIELSTDYHGKEVHIVGLYIDIENEQLLKKTAEYRKCRSERNALMVEALQKEGLSITMEELVAENPDCVITRANIARFLYEHGQIKSVREAFDRYIGDHCKCYVGRLKVASTDAVCLIKEAGGTAILAHPLLYGLSNTNLQKMIDELKPAGLDGLEAIYSTYTTGEEQQMKRLARENGLLISGGSDFHGSNKPDITLGRGRGHLYIPYSVLETIKAGR